MRGVQAPARQYRRSTASIPPRLASRSSRAAIAASGPETTVRAGPLTAASESSGPSSGAISASGSGTASMAPGGSACIRRPRSATSARASSSEKTPARQAATYSPRLWPSIARGRTPQLIQSRASECSTTNRAGWARAVCSSRRAASSRAPSARVEHLAQVEAEQRPQDLAAAVDAVAEGRLGLVQLAPHAGVLRALAREQEVDRAVARLRRRGSAGVPAASASAAPAGSRATEEAAVLAGAPPHLEGEGGVGERQVGMAAQVGGQVGPQGVERGGGVGREHEELPGARGAGGLGGGASSRMTWALVPPTPKELTPARRGAPSGSPVGERGVDVERAAREVDLRVGPLEVQAGRDLAVLRAPAPP